MMLDIKTTFVFNNIKKNKPTLETRRKKALRKKKTGGFSQKDRSLGRI